MQNNPRDWGFHLIIDAAGCSSVEDAEKIKAFAKDLVKRIDMTAYGEPQLVHFGSGHLEGYTLVQLIETSNIIGHFCDEDGSCFLDVFSCKTFDPRDAVKCFDEYFAPAHVRTVWLGRSIPQSSSDVTLGV
jgi:S-adenosylmethionine/arginine decarboxylase-like enzyme